MARRICPKCAEFVDKKLEVCPFCGQVLIEKDTEDVLEIKPQEENNLSEANEAEVKIENEVNKQPKRHPHKKKKQEIFATKDANGELEIKTDDVTFFEGAKENYSAKKARGEVKSNRPQWWEIYKWADIILARRKVKKEVNKAAIVEPEYINHWTLLLFAILFGWFGGHNYYARNFKKAIFVTLSLAISITVISIPAFKGVIDVSIGGGFGFVVMILWVWDVIGIIMHKYKFRESALSFVLKLNLETRKKLGKKYENIKEWFVPYIDRKQFKKVRRVNKSEGK